MEEFAHFVSMQIPSPKDKGEPPFLETLSVDISGDTAVAKVRDGRMGIYGGMEQRGNGGGRVG